MGACLSRCGEPHHQGVAGPISHRSYSFDNNTESLNKFLHLHGTTSPESTPAIPHSGELFSLPPSEPELSSFAPSPASPGRSSRASCSWKRVRPTSEHHAAAHQRLVEAVARLERLNDGKQFSASDLTTTKTPSMRSRHVRHYQLPLQLQLPITPRDTTMAHSVTTFVREVESFVEAPSRRDETDSDEMFTVFEAISSEESEVRKKPLPSSTSLHRLVQSVGSNPERHRTEILSPVAENLAPAVPKSRRGCKSDQISKVNSVSQSRLGKSDAADPSIQSMQEKKGASEVDVNVVAAVKKSLSPRRLSPSRRRALKGRVSRSLELEDNMTTKLGSLPVTACCPDIQLSEQAMCDLKRDEENGCTVELWATPQEIQVEDQAPTAVPVPESVVTNSELPSLQSPSTLASAKSSFRERGNFECPETDHARSEETMSLGSSECTDSVSSSFSSVRSSEITGAQADFHPVPEVGDSPMFLSRAFSNLLKLLQVTDIEAQTGPECAAALDQDEKMDRTLKRTQLPRAMEP